MQDVHLGLLVALLPALAGQRAAASVKGGSGVVQGILNGLDNSSASGIVHVCKGMTLCFYLASFIT